MDNERYSLSFTTAGLLYRESVAVAELFHRLNNWDRVREHVVADNILQARKQSTAKKIYSEISSRLKRLTHHQMILLTDGQRQEQNQILWLAISKRYRFIHDFAVEVLREKFLRRDLELNYNDYDIFFNRKEEWRPELEQLAQPTRIKIRQQLFKIMRDADLISAADEIEPALMTSRTIKAIAADSPQLLAIFPISESHIKEMIP